MLSCEFSDSGEDSSGLFSGHQPATNDFTVTIDANQYSKANDIIRVTLTHPVTQVVTGSPRLALNIGGSNVYANYVSGDKTKSLIFEYTVLSAQNDTDGIEVDTNIDLNGGSLQFNTLSGSISSNLSLPSIDTSSFFVDNIAPNISIIAPPVDSTYTIGQSLQYVVSLDESVNVTGTPSLSLNVGGILRSLDYTTGSGTSILIFQTSVLATDIDNDGAEGISPLNLNTGTITDLAGNDANLNFSLASVTPPNSNVIVNGSLSTITNIILPTDNTYLTGAVLEVNVEFSDVVTVTGSPSLDATLTSGTKSFIYTSGSGTNTLSFEYTVDAADNDNDGIEIISPLLLNGGTIIDSNSQGSLLTFTGPITSSIILNPIAATLSLDPLAAINISNNAAYTITGTCSENSGDVNINIGGISDTVICTSNIYSSTLDLSSLADDLALTVDVDHSLATPISTTVLKDTIAPTTLTIDTLTDINLSNYMSYDFTGTCSEESEDVTYTIGSLTGSVTCSSGIFSFTGIDLSSEADSATFNISVDHNDEALNPATTVSLSTIKDTIAPTIVITSSPDINSSNETAYQLIGTCSENGFAVSVDIGGVTESLICTSSTWVTSFLDLTSLADGTVTVLVSQSKANSNTGSDTVDITKSSTPTVSITIADDIDSSNETSYEIYGLCSENGVDVTLSIGGIPSTASCTTGSWSSGVIDTSSLVDGTVTITADHSTATQVTLDVTKDSTSELVTITSASNISVSNQSAYTLSGTCTTNASLVTIDIGGLSYAPTCSSNSWSTGVIDLSSLADGVVTITADHTTATQAAINILKDTTSPTVDSLSSPATMPDSIDLTWNLNDPGGFTIDDYIINFRVKGSTTWLPFSDGVSTTPSATVTGLLESTTYEFRVNVQYDTVNNSEWSNTIEAETQPNSPLFGENIAMNVGGATSSTVTAFEDSTNITLNGVALTTLNKGQTHVFTSTQFDVIDADKPIYTAGRRSSANVVWSPTTWAGKTFSFNSIRSNPQNLYIYAIEAATVQVKQGSTVLASMTLAANQTTTLSWSVFGSYQVVSSGSILAFHISNTVTDPKPLLPSALEIIGFPSNSMRITSDQDSTNYTLRHSDSTLMTGSLGKFDSIVINPQGGTTSLYRSDSLLLTSDKKISGASFADSNGSCAAPFLPTNLMRRKYIINVSADYVAFASKLPGTINVIDSFDTIITTLTLSRSGSDSKAPFKARIGTTSGGTRFESSVPMAGWYQPNTNIGASSQDETILYGTD